MATKITSGSIFSAGAVVTGVDADAPPAVPSPSPEPAPAPATAQILPLSRAVSLLMDASATADGSVVDSSANSHSITTHGDVSQSSFSPYRSGGYSWEFTGQGNYLSVPNSDGSSDYDFRNVDFTVEFFMNLNGSNHSNNPVIMGGQQGWYVQLKNTDSRITFYDNAVEHHANVTLDNSSWYHVAITRSGSTLKTFLNGSEVYSGSASTSNGRMYNSDFLIASYATNTNLAYIGLLSDIRVVKGTALYTENFTSPTERLTEVAGTSLLTCNLPYLQSGLTAHGNVSSVAAGPYDYAGYSESLHGGSYVFDGNGDYLQSSTHVSLAMGSSDFTVEGWVNTDNNANSTYPTWMSNWSSGWGANAWSLHTHHSAQPNKFTFYCYNYSAHGPLLESSLTVKENTWYHVSLTRSGSTFSLWVNGELEATATFTGAIDNGVEHSVFLPSPVAVNSWSGSISDFRIVKGTAVYTESFTPPTAPLTAVAGTSLLLSGNNASIRDESQSVESISVFGNTTVADSSPYGTGKSMTFDGDGDYVSSPALTSLPGDFTIESWVYPTDLSSNRMIFEGRPSNSSSGDYITFQWHTSRGLGLYHNGWQIESGSNELVTNQWQHVALTRSGSSIKLFIDGAQVGGTYTSSTEFLMNGSNRIGALYSLSSTWWQGNIADFRIVNGTAVYTENFTVPSAPLGDYTETVASPEPAPESEPSGPVELVGEPSVSSFSHIPSTRYATPGSPAVTDAATGVDVGRPDTGSSTSAMIDVTVEIGTEYEFSFTATTQSGDTMFMGVIPAQGATTPEFGYVGDNALGQYPNTVHNRASVSGSGDSQTIVFTATQTDLQIVMWNAYSENLVNVQFISLKATS